MSYWERKQKRIKMMKDLGVSLSKREKNEKGRFGSKMINMGLVKKIITDSRTHGLASAVGMYFLGKEIYKAVSPYAYVGVGRHGWIDTTGGDNFVDYFARPLAGIVVGLVTYYISKKIKNRKEVVR